MKEWHLTKNGVFSPVFVSACSGKTVWWICSKGHEWLAKISDRYNNHGCPYCSGRKVLTGINDLKTIYPELSAEWDYEANGNIKPEDVKPGSKKKVWWICSHGHKWLASIKSRKYGHGCPFCSGRNVIVGKTDLATTNPKVVGEWNHSKNGSLLPTMFSTFSNKIVWWSGRCGHEWQDSITHRTQGRECPVCNKQNRTSFPEQAIFYYVKKVWPDAINGYTEIFQDAMELDIFIPSLKFGIEYDGKAWHSSSEALIREKRKFNVCKKNGISLIRIKEDQEQKAIDTCDILLITDRNLDNTIKELSRYFPLYDDIDTVRDRIVIQDGYLSSIKNHSFAIKYPDIASEWHPIKNGSLSPNMFSAGSGENVWWICSLGHEWKTAINERTCSGNGCPYCSNHRLLKGYNDLATTDPILAKEWHPSKNNDLLPTMVLPSSRRDVWWLCIKGHEWKSPLSGRSRGRGCPICAGKRVQKGINDLVTLNPKLDKEWHQTRNRKLRPDEVTTGSKKKVWWKCIDCDNEWTATVSARSRGSGCPSCAVSRRAESYKKYKKATIGTLADNAPDLSLEWHPNLNGEIKPIDVSSGTNIKVWWKCSKCANEWQATVSSRVKRKYGCPECAKKNKAESNRKNSILRSGSLSKTNLTLSKEWHPTKNDDFTPNDFSASSGRKAWWVCSKGHEWIASIANRNSGGGCPYCSSRRILAGYNDLATKNPRIAEQWHQTLNDTLLPSDVMASSSKKVWWECPKCRYAWQAPVSNRSKGSGCPVCAGNTVVRGYNDLETINPILASEWHPTKNGNSLPNKVSNVSRKKVWWICRYGHVWEEEIWRRDQEKLDCPECQTLSIKS